MGVQAGRPDGGEAVPVGESSSFTGIGSSAGSPRNFECYSVLELISYIVRGTIYEDHFAGKRVFGSFPAAMPPRQASA